MISELLAAGSFVGRREELAFLHESLARSRDERARFVPIEGEAGIGKSRLIEEFASTASSDATFATGQCSEHVRTPYLPFSTILAKLDARGARALHPRGRRGNAEDKAAFFETTAEILERAGRREPVVAVVEDLQWADSATLELLAYLLHNLERARVLFIVSLRIEGAAQNSALAAFRLQASRRRVAAIRLRGLRRNEIRYLVAQRLGIRNAAAIAPEAVAQIESLSEGNPLFAEELVRTLRESDRLNLATNAPLSLQAMLSERLTPLSQEQRAVLVRAALVGRHFDAAFVANIVGLPLDRVLHVLQRAVDADLIVPAGDSRLEFSFRHAMIRQALADQLIVGLSAPLHARVAEEIEALGADGRAAELAYHWSSARVADKARFYNERAAEAAWNLYAYRDAIGFYTTALRWEYPAGLERAAVYERIGTLLYIEGCGEEPSAWFARCRDEYERLGNTAGTAHALLRLADQYWVDARTHESLEAAGRAAAALARLDRPAMMAEAMLSLARFSITVGDAAAALAGIANAQRLAQHFDDVSQASFYEVRAETHAALGNARAALDDAAEASRLANGTGLSETIAQVENNRALVAADLGELDLAVECHEIALAEARRTSMPWRVAYSALNYAETLTLRGELERARSLAWEAIESGVTTATFKTKAAAVGIPLALLLNDRRLLEACADEAAVTAAERSREAQRIASVGAAFAGLRAAQGSPEQARRLLGRSIRAIEHPHRCARLLIEIAASGGEPERTHARRAMARWTARPRVKRACRLLFESLCAQDAPRERRHRLARAAATACARVGWQLHAVRALELAGEAAQAARRYAAMGDVRNFERLQGERSTGPAAPDLSRRQMEVARLVADGETNRTIATRLNISEHTVEHHLSTIYARLGLRSRSGLAACIGRLTHP